MTARLLYHCPNRELRVVAILTPVLTSSLARNQSRTPALDAKLHFRNVKVKACVTVTLEVQ